MISFEKRAYELAIRDARQIVRDMIEQGEKLGFALAWVNYRILQKEFREKLNG